MKLIVEKEWEYGQNIEGWLLNNAITTNINVKGKVETYFFSPYNRHGEPTLFITKEGELVYPESQYKLEGKYFFYLKRYKEENFQRYHPVESYTELLEDPSTIVETLNPTPVINVDIVIEPMYSEDSYYYSSELVKDSFYIYLSSKIIDRFPSEVIGKYPIYYEPESITKSELEEVSVNGVNLLEMLYSWYPSLEKSIIEFINQQDEQIQEDNYLTLTDENEPIVKIYNNTSFNSIELN